MFALFSLGGMAAVICYRGQTAKPARRDMPDELVDEVETESLQDEGNRESQTETEAAVSELTPL